MTIASCLAAAPQMAQTPLSSASPSPSPASREPSNQEINDRFEKEIAARIAGKEKEPAGQVFRNLQIEWLKAVPARRLLVIMNMGYSRALGVACTHCHVAEDFTSDEKRPKRAAREMAVMHRGVNDRLRDMKNLSPAPDHSINCFTCHRGKINPNEPAN